MVYYRLYMVNPITERFVGFEELEASDDVAAVRMASHHVGSQGLELWCGKRKVKAFPVQPRPSGSRDEPSAV